MVKKWLKHLQVKLLKEESFGGIPQSLTAHIKHQQDLNTYLYI